MYFLGNREMENGFLKGELRHQRPAEGQPEDTSIIEKNEAFENV